MTPEAYENTLSELARDLRMNVARELSFEDDDGQRQWLAEIANNAADMLLHQVITMQVVRKILADLRAARDPKITGMVQALETVIAAAPEPKTVELDRPAERETVD